MFPQFENPQVYIKEILPVKVFNKLLTDNDGLFSSFVNAMIEIRYGRIWIWNYHGQL